MNADCSVDYPLEIKLQTNEIEVESLQVPDYVTVSKEEGETKELEEIDNN